MCCVLGLQRLRGWEDVDEELCEMRVEEQSERAEGRLSVLNLFTFRSLRWQLLSVIFMNMGQQLSGVNAVSTTLKHHTDDSFSESISVVLNVLLNLQIYYYADSIYSSAGVADDHVQYVTVGTGAVNVFMTIAAVSHFFDLLMLFKV